MPKVLISQHFIGVTLLRSFRFVKKQLMEQMSSNIIEVFIISHSVGFPYSYLSTSTAFWWLFVKKLPWSFKDLYSKMFLFPRFKFVKKQSTNEMSDFERHLLVDPDEGEHRIWGLTARMGISACVMVTSQHVTFRDDVTHTVERPRGEEKVAVPGWISNLWFIYTLYLGFPFLY